MSSDIPALYSDWAGCKIDIDKLKARVRSRVNPSTGWIEYWLESSCLFCCDFHDGFTCEEFAIKDIIE